MNLTCYIVDDEPHAITLMSDYINKTPGLSLAGSHTNPLLALAQITNNPPALAFLDIDMPELSGITLAGLVNKRSTVIFTTSFRDYGPEAFEQNAVGYLLKPFSYDRFLACVQQIKEKQGILPPVWPGHFFIKTELKGKMLRIETEDITYIKSLANYVEICLLNEKITAYLTLSELLTKLPSEKFSRIEKSHIVAHKYIRSIEHFQARLTNGIVLPIGRVYSQPFLEKIRANLLVSGRTPPEQ